MAPNTTPRTPDGIAARLRQVVANRHHAALMIAVEIGLALIGLPLALHLIVGAALEALVVSIELFWWLR
jgi:hypothetical protein